MSAPAGRDPRLDDMPADPGAQTPPRAPVRRIFFSPSLVPHDDSERPRPAREQITFAPAEAIASYFDRVRGEVTPYALPERTPRQKRRSRTALQLALIAVGAALAAFYIVDVPSQIDWAQINLRDMIQRQAEKTGKSAPIAIPRLAVRDVRGPNGDWQPLGLTLLNTPESASVIVSGLLAGARLSAGRPLDANRWWLSANDVQKTEIRPAAGFVGKMDLIAELRFPDDVVRDRKSLHTEWTADNAANASAAPQKFASAGAIMPVTAPAPAAVAAPVSAPVAAPNPPAAPLVKPEPKPAAATLDKEEIALLIKRGEEFIGNGDFASARLLLRRPAEAGDARAAFALAATYDPNILKRIGVSAQAADPALARSWYRRAADLGAAQAADRLDVLARSNP